MRIEIVSYDNEWPALFQREAAAVQGALGNQVLSLEHVGSTSVPGLAAKPVIDIAMALANSADEPAYVQPLQSAGYTLHVREPDWHEHRLFRRGDRDVHLHVFSSGCSE